MVAFDRILDVHYWCGKNRKRLSCRDFVIRPPAVRSVESGAAWTSAALAREVERGRYRPTLRLHIVFRCRPRLSYVKSRIDRERRRHASVSSTFHRFPTLGHRSPYDGLRPPAVVDCGHLHVYRHRGRRLVYTGTTLVVYMSRYL